MYILSHSKYLTCQQRSAIFSLLAGLWMFVQPLHAAPAAFSLHGLAGWQAQIFKGKALTQYRVEDGVLRADCRASASGYVWKAPLDLAKTPILTWRWRAHDVLPAGDERSKAGDDFIARVYGVRSGGLAPWRTRSLVYVWSRSAAGADWPSAYASQAHVIALRGKDTPAGEWREERRDLQADFRRYFGLDVTQLDALALMTDCDDSGAAGRADYGDIRLLAR